MKSNTARKHKSRIVGDLLAGISPERQLKTRTKMSIAARIDDLLIANSWSKSDFAAKLDKHQSEITKWLSGTHNFTIDTLAEIAVALKVSVIDLIATKQEQPAQVMHFMISIHAQKSPIPLTTPFIRGSKQTMLINPRNIA